MKKIFTLLAALVVGGAAASAENVVFIGETGYPTIEEAVAAAAENATIQVKGNIEINSTVDLKSKPLTIEGVGDVTVSCTNTKGVAFSIEKVGVTIKNLKLEYTAKEISTSQLIDVAGTEGGTLTMSDCEIKNFNGNTDRGIIVIRANGAANLTNVVFSNNTVKEGRGEIFTGNKKLTLNGSTNASVYIEKDHRINVGENLTATSPIALYIDDNNNNRNGSAVVIGSRDANKFKLISKIYALKPDDNKNKNELKTVTAIARNENTGITYLTLLDAVNKAEENDVISVLADATENSRVTVGKNITVQGIDKDGQKIKVSSDANNIFMVAGGPATVKNLSLVYSGTNACAKNFIEVNGGNLTLEDCEICNYNGTGSNRAVVTKGNGSHQVHLNNVLFKGNTIEDGKGEIYFGTSLSSISGTTNGSIYIGGKNTFKADASFDPAPREEVNALDADVAPTANTVKVYTEQHDIDSPVVEGTTEGGIADPTKFELSNSAWELTAKDGKLVIKAKESVGIAGVEAEENAPVEYYNLNGVQVKADNMTPGVYVRRQGKNVTKVMVK